MSKRAKGLKGVVRYNFRKRRKEERKEGAMVAAQRSVQSGKKADDDER